MNTKLTTALALTNPLTLVIGTALLALSIASLALLAVLAVLAIPVLFAAFCGCLTYLLLTLAYQAVFPGRTEVNETCLDEVLVPDVECLVCGVYATTIHEDCARCGWPLAGVQLPQIQQEAEPVCLPQIEVEPLMVAQTEVEPATVSQVEVAKPLVEVTAEPFTIAIPKPKRVRRQRQLSVAAEAKTERPKVIKVPSLKKLKQLEKEALYDLAKSLGLKVTKRMKQETLIERINAARS